MVQIPQSRDFFFTKIGIFFMVVFCIILSERKIKKQKNNKNKKHYGKVKKNWIRSRLWLTLYCLSGYDHYIGHVALSDLPPLWW